MSRVVGVCVLCRVEQIIDASLIRRLGNGLDRDVLRRHLRGAISIGEREAHRCSAPAKARHQTVLIDGQNCLIGRSPRGGATCIGRISHRRQLKRGELSHGVSARNRNARGRRGGNNVNRIGNRSRLAVTPRNSILDGRITHCNTSYCRIVFQPRYGSNILIARRPIVCVREKVAILVIVAQRNLLADLYCLLGTGGSHRVGVCVTIARFGNSGGTIGASGSVARGGLALGRGRAALAGCDGVGRALVGLRLVGRSLNGVLALRGIADGSDYLRSGGRLGLSGRLGDNLNGNVRVEGSFRYGVESLRVRMELSFLAVDQGLYSLEVIAGHGCNAKDKRCMHRHGDRLRGCRKSLTVVVQGSVGNIDPNVYLAICFGFSSSLLGGSLFSSGLIGGSLLGSGLISSSLLGSSTLSLGSLSFGSSLRLISGLGLIGGPYLVSRLVARCRLLPLSLRLVHLLYGLLSVLRCNGLCQGTGSTRRPHGKDQQRRHCCRNDPL